MFSFPNKMAPRISRLTVAKWFFYLQVRNDFLSQSIVLSSQRILANGYGAKVKDETEKKDEKEEAGNENEKDGQKSPEPAPDHCLKILPEKIGRAHV